MAHRKCITQRRRKGGFWKKVVANLSVRCIAMDLTNQRLPGFLTRVVLLPWESRSTVWRVWGYEAGLGLPEGVRSDRLIGKWEVGW